MKQIGNGFYILAGFLCMILGTIGVILPLLPTTPFLLLAAVLFAKGSKRFHTWFLATSLYRNHIGDFMETKSMTLRKKFYVLGMITLMCSILYLFAPIWHAKVCIVVVVLFHYLYFIFKVKTKVEEMNS